MPDDFAAWKSLAVLSGSERCCHAPSNVVARIERQPLDHWPTIASGPSIELLPWLSCLHAANRSLPCRPSHSSVRRAVGRIHTTTQRRVRGAAIRRIGLLTPGLVSSQLTTVGPTLQIISTQWLKWHIPVMIGLVAIHSIHDATARYAMAAGTRAEHHDIW